MTVLHHDPFGAHLECVGMLASFGLEPPKAWTELRDRFGAFSSIGKPMAARLAAAVLEPKSNADMPALRALALAEESASSVDEASVTAIVRAEAHNQLLASYAPLAVKNYRAVATAFDDAAKLFVKAADTFDPEAPSDVIVHRDDRERQAWLSAAVAAQELDTIVPVLAAAAELAGAPVGTSHRRPDADPLVLSLVCDPAKAHRRQVWEAWAGVGTCGRWSALHRLGVTIRAHRDPERLTEYRAPRPFTVTFLNGGKRSVTDPEDSPQSAVEDPDWEPAPQRHERSVV